MEKLPELYSSENIKLNEKIVHMHLFNPYHNYDWWVFEYSKQERVFFVYANLNNTYFAEYGYLSLDEIIELNKSFPYVEKENNFKPIRFKDIDHPSLAHLKSK